MHTHTHTHTHTRARAHTHTHTHTHTRTRTRTRGLRSLPGVSGNMWCKAGSVVRRGRGGKVGEGRECGGGWLPENKAGSGLKGGKGEKREGCWPAHQAASNKCELGAQTRRTSITAPYCTAVYLNKLLTK